MATQSRFDLGEPRQNGFEFPKSAAEKYQPRIHDYIGLSEPKRIMLGLLKRPRSCNLLYVGPAGTGKTTFGISFAQLLPGSLVHVGAQKCDVDAVDRLWDKFAYMPAVGLWWIALIDEADQMTSKAQLQFLSHMDGTAALKPLWGGGMTKGEAPKVIRIFTSNGIGPERTTPPVDLLPRFLSRCMVIPFRPPETGELARYLKKVWARENGRSGLPIEYFEHLAEGVGVRDALMRLDTELLRNPGIREVKTMLSEKQARIEERQNTQANKWELAAEIESDPAVIAAVANYKEAMQSGASEESIAAKKAWVTMRRTAAKERLESAS